MKRIFKKLISAFAIFSLSMSTCVYANTVDPEYEWKNVTMGGGGYIIGYLYHPLDSNLKYARGDVGGVWRWDSAQNKWLSLCNGFDISQYSYYGCDGFAIDPQNPDVIYMAAGKNLWVKGDVLKSTDRGATWTETGLNKPFASNGEYRYTGECIMVDPKNSNIVYAGTRKDGLYKSTDGAASWQKVEGIPINSTDGTTPVRAILFDPTTNGSTQRIYVSVINQGLYKSEDAGTTWSHIKEAPEVVNRMDIANDGTLYIASDSGVLRFREGVWQDVSPKADTAFRSVVTDPDNSNFAVALSYSAHTIMKQSIYYSADGGANWVSATDANKIEKIKHTEYLEEDNFSSSTAFIEMNPHDSKNIVFGDWFGIWETKDITASTVVWEDNNYGIEEMCGTKTVSHPDNPYKALMAVVDNDGFPVTDFDKMQTRKFNNREREYGTNRYMSTNDLDICEDNGNYVVRVGVDHNQSNLADYSLDGGNTWTTFISDPMQPYNQGFYRNSRVRFSSNLNKETGKPASIVLIQSGVAPLVSQNMGESWTEINSLPVFNFSYQSTKEFLDKDYVLDDTFYCCDDNGLFYRSVDGGLSWSRRGSLELSDIYRLKAAPDMAGEVWISSGSSITQNKHGKLYRSSNGLKTIQEVEGITDVVTFGFGKGAPGRNNPTVYVYGAHNGQMGIYRSVDMGETWKRIDNDNIKIGNAPGALDGSRKEFGLVFISTDGSGNFYGRISGADSDTENSGTTEENITDVKVKISENEITVYGKVKNAEEGDKISYLVLNPNYTVKDWGNPCAIQSQAEGEIGKDRSFSYTFVINDELYEGQSYFTKGAFTFFLRTDSSDAPYSVQFELERWLSLKNSSGVETSAIEPGQTYYANVIGDRKGRFLVGVYAQNRMILAKCEENREKEVVITLPAEKNQNYVIRLFLWDEGLRPLGKACVVKEK